MDQPLVERLLDALLDLQNMPDVLRLVASEFSADHLFAYLVTPKSTEVFTSRGSDVVTEAGLKGGWHERNPRMQRGLDFARRGKLGLLTDWRLFEPQEIARDPFEQDFATRYEITHYAGSFVPFSKGSFFVLSFERGSRKGPYVDSEERRLAEFIGGAGHALRYALRGQAHMARTLVDTMSDNGVAHAWVDCKGALRYASPAFELILDRFLGERNGCLVPLSGEPEPFHRLISRAAAGVRDCSVVVLHDLEEPEKTAFARAIPLRTAEALLHPHTDVLLSVELPFVARTGFSEVLASRFRLTPSEIRLVQRLNEGKSLRQAADADGISYETARTRLKVVFNKMSVSRQSELVRLLERMTFAS